MHPHDIEIFVGGVLVGLLLRGLFSRPQDAWQSRSGVTDSAVGQPAIALGTDTDQVHALIRQEKMIQAIKLYREQTGVGLKDAKDAVEDMKRRLPR